MGLENIGVVVLWELRCGGDLTGQAKHQKGKRPSYQELLANPARLLAKERGGKKKENNKNKISRKARSAQSKQRDAEV